uniref:Secreted protein n=1 Tax=Steinernema glaseri TaxID=37863 RepID=A0A1I7YD93_9BILA
MFAHLHMNVTALVHGVEHRCGTLASEGCSSARREVNKTQEPSKWSASMHNSFSTNESNCGDDIDANENIEVIHTGVGIQAQFQFNQVHETPARIA